MIPTFANVFTVRATAETVEIDHIHQADMGDGASTQQLVSRVVMTRTAADALSGLLGRVLAHPVEPTQPH